MARYALVTGGSSGIGEQYVRQLAAEGRNVVVVSNRDEENRRVAEATAAEFGVQVVPLTIDLAEAIKETYGA